jgi:outer membrane immunogenic protein
MQRVLTATLALLAVSAVQAMGADLPAKAPMVPVMAPVFSWTGVYIGANVGGAFNDSHFNLDPTGCFLTGCGAGGVGGNASRTDAARFGNNAAFTGGGQIGYNWQFSPSWLFGLETDINYNGTRSSVNAILPLPFAAGSTFNYTISQKLDWFGTARGRLGWLPADRVMIYGTGGLAYGRVTSSTGVFFPTSGDSYAGSIDNVRLGWTAGGGIEWAFAQNWTAKAEYLYVDLGNVQYTDACVTFCIGNTYSSTVRTREHIARFGINYLFNAGPPVVAKY